MLQEVQAGKLEPQLQPGTSEKLSTRLLQNSLSKVFAENAMLRNSRCSFGKMKVLQVEHSDRTGTEVVPTANLILSTLFDGPFETQLAIPRLLA